MFKAELNVISDLFKGLDLCNVSSFSVLLFAVDFSLKDVKWLDGFMLKVQLWEALGMQIKSLNIIHKEFV